LEWTGSGPLGCHVSGSFFCVFFLWFRVALCLWKIFDSLVDSTSTKTASNEPDHSGKNDQRVFLSAVLSSGSEGRDGFPAQAEAKKAIPALAFRPWASAIMAARGPVCFSGVLCGSVGRLS